MGGLPCFLRNSRLIRGMSRSIFSQSGFQLRRERSQSSRLSLELRFFVVALAPFFGLPDESSLIGGPYFPGAGGH